ncbi:MAG TPA: amidohydrolase [Caulobacterales bacterium]|nr:amidohydrolase [Caulobacterales bacterium]
MANAAPDVVLVHAKLFGAAPNADALAIAGRRITAIGSTREIAELAGPRTRVIDAEGRLVIPGITEAHAHIQPPLPGQSIAVPGEQSPDPTADELIARIKAAAASGEGWITGPIGPTIASDALNWRDRLDAASPARPVFLHAWWGHGTLVNSAALRALHIDDSTRDPPGGWYGRDALGRLDGRLYEAAEVAAMRAIAPADQVARLSSAFGAAQKAYLRWGVTSVHDMANAASLAETIAALRASHPQIHITIYAWGSDGGPLDHIWNDVDRVRNLPPRVRIGGTKWVLDGSPLERNAFEMRDYADRPGWRGRSNFTDAELRAIFTTVLHRREGVALHIAGEAETELVLDAMQAVAGPAKWRGKRVRFEHGGHLTPELLARARQLGVMVVQNPLHFDDVRDGRGLSLTHARKDPLQTLLNEDVPLAFGSDVAFGSDAGGAAANPFLNMMLAVQYPANPVESLSREQALEAYTAGGAYAEGEERTRGRLAVGMDADLAVLSQDILESPLATLPGTRSILTIVDGDVVYEETPETLGLDRKAVSDLR